VNHEVISFETPLFVGIAQAARLTGFKPEVIVDFAMRDEEDIMIDGEMIRARSPIETKIHKWSGEILVNIQDVDLIAGAYKDCREYSVEIGEDTSKWDDLFESPETQE
jgi:hypothetical protein